MFHQKKECVAMILAGGQGSRLHQLTEQIAKPAVPFGGKYRMIDFTLSNCVNSHIDTVGVLTQYRPLVLNRYIGNGQPWGLDRKIGGIHILPPYVGNSKAEWYLGTANAVWQNQEFIDEYDPEYLLILSGDHIYSMDYQKMLDFHKQCGADGTIAVIDVPLEDASRFGIMETDLKQKIVSFQEKPKKPKSTHASMGIYIFNWSVLKEYLIQDSQQKNSKHDFGGDIIPAMLADNKNLYAYSFDGYWIDAGTIESLWQANMDLLSGKAPLRKEGRKIYTRNTCQPPHYIEQDAIVCNSLVAEGCIIEGKVEHSVLFNGVVVEQGAEIKDSVLFPGTKVKSNAKVIRVITGENVIIESGCTVGGKDTAITVVPKDKRVSQEKKTLIKKGEDKK
ncbi:MAG: glucose-1-phosphate adenylyltransferase [Massiliimalia sp.]|jgi:glucose-1-phosphate adenylyltransferase